MLAKIGRSSAKQYDAAKPKPNQVFHVNQPLAHM